MDEELAALRKLVKQDWWRWMPGMLARRYHPQWPRKRVVKVENASLRFADGDCHGRRFYLPVLSDPATKGCLLSLLEAFEPGGGYNPTARCTLAYVEACRTLERWREAGEKTS